jgi:hypothetical protein
MKRWAIFTILLYALAMAVLTLPLALLAFARWGGRSQSVAFADALAIYNEWGYWAWLALMGIGQGSLLLVPVGIAERRQPSRRRLIVPVLFSGFFLANLLLGGVTSLLCLFLRDRGFDIFAILGEVTWGPAAYSVAAELSQGARDFGAASSNYVVGMMTGMAVFWVLWAMLFYFFARADDPDSFVKRTTRWLLRGSILELLVAVPSHVIVRHRGDCCAPLGTFWGITTGLSVMLLCFGPGIFFLFSERMARLQPKASTN